MPLARVLLFALLLSAAPSVFAQAEGVEVVRVAEGVYASVRREPPGLMFDSNSVFIINDEDVIVVDTNISPASARENLAALRRLTQKPVRYVVNTHWHDDHLAGNEVYLIIPGHGQVLRDDAYARLLVRLLASLSEQTAAAVARGETLEQARRSVRLEEFRKLFAGDSQLKSFIFSFYVAGPGVAAAYREASAKK
jgi:flavorubredoxin